MARTRPIFEPRTSRQAFAYSAGRRVHRRGFPSLGRTFPGISTVESHLTERQHRQRLAMGDERYFTWFVRGWWSVTPDRR